MRQPALWVARHAPVTVTDTCYGRTEVPVDRPSEAAAAVLIDGFAAEPPDVIWSSTASRCRSVAQIVARHHGVALRVDAALQELDFGRWEGRAWSEIAEHDSVAHGRWMRGWEHESPPQGERPHDIETRVRGWLEALSVDAVHALVAHAGVVRALRVAIEGRSWCEAMSAPVPHLTWVRFAPFTPRKSVRA